jgi:hypothetical protein
LTFPDSGTASTSGSGEVTRGNMSANINAVTTMVPNPLGDISNHCLFVMKWHDTLRFISDNLPDGTAVPVRFILFLDSQISNSEGNSGSPGSMNYAVARAAGCMLIHQNYLDDPCNESKSQRQEKIYYILTGKDDPYGTLLDCDMEMHTLASCSFSDPFPSVNSSINAKVKIFVQPLTAGVKCFSASGISYMNTATNPAINLLLSDN